MVNFNEYMNGNDYMCDYAALIKIISRAYE